MTRAAARVLSAGLVLLTVGCDQATKQLAAGRLGDGVRRSYWHDVFRLQYAENAGSFLSLGTGLPQAVRAPVLIGITVLVLAGVVLALRQPTLGLAARLGLYLVLAAGVSNLIDRILRGRVIDFLNLGIGSLRTGIFNLADLALVFGLALVVLAPRARRS